MSGKIKILFLAANPMGMNQLKLDKEAREISSKIRAAEHRDSIEFVTRWAVRPDDLQQILLETQPHVLHFSGHGIEDEAILLVDDNDRPSEVSKEVLQRLLSVLKDNLQVVVLNACYSRHQAKAITDCIDCAVGMNKAIGDEAAIAFAGSFYRALGFGRALQEAFELGKVALLQEEVQAEHTPTLFVRQGVVASDLKLLADAAAISIVDDRSHVGEVLVREMTESKEPEKRQPRTATAKAVRVPDFECGGVVEGDYFIDRENELSYAEEILRKGRRFLLVGEPRVGKTSFCEELMRRMRVSKDNNILATRLDLESLGKYLNIDTFLGHTVIYMLGEAARIVFNRSYADLRQKQSALPPEVQRDTEFAQLRAIAAEVRERIYYKGKMRPTPLERSHFVQYTKDLLTLIRAKGKTRFVIFYDEANKMTPELSIDLLGGNAKVLAASCLTSVFVASEEMAERLRDEQGSFGSELQLGSFKSRIHMKHSYWRAIVTMISRTLIISQLLTILWTERGNCPKAAHSFFSGFFAPPFKPRMLPGLRT